jgi:hypothetical protein
MNELIREIESAFADTSYPGNSRIGTLELTAIFRQFHWRQVFPEMLFYFRDSIKSFTPEAFRFYLPAMMLGVLRYHDELDTLTDNLICSLALPEADAPAGSYWYGKLTQIVALMSPAEILAVYNFLLKCRELYPEWAYSEYQEEELEEAIEFWSTLI